MPVLTGSDTEPPDGSADGQKPSGKKKKTRIEQETPT